jgi:very-short-patch-repair endonuclease
VSLENPFASGKDRTMDCQRIVEIRLHPEQLSGDACEAFASALAQAVRSFHTVELPAGTNVTWHLRAAELLYAGALPLPPSFPLAVQVEQLTGTLAVSGHRILVISPTFSPHLKRAVEWLESHSKISVEATGDSPAAIGDNSMAVTALTLADQPVQKGCSVSVLTLEGQPHWASPGEQKLHKRLEADPFLAGLFRCNIKVVSRYGRVYCADFLHDTKKLIVEVDGYGFHGNRQAFFSDRHRDYELLVSGYLTLRIDHEEILRDVESVVGKIRSVLQHLDDLRP